MWTLIFSLSPAGLFIETQRFIWVKVEKSTLHGELEQDQTLVEFPNTTLMKKLAFSILDAM